MKKVQDMRFGLRLTELCHKKSGPARSPPAMHSPPDKISQKSFNFLRSDQAYTQSNTMKRKLDANDVPSPKAAVAKESELDFEALNLDPRLRQALIKEKFTKPTLVQSKAIPLALEGKDILGELTLLYAGPVRSY